jgi:predicted ATPase
MAQLDTVSIRGFKSIEKLDDFDLRPLNVLIGANGSGKSNFVEFFRVLRAIVDERFQAYVAKNGPADGYFFDGVRHTKQIEADLRFGKNRYVLALEPTAEGSILIAAEKTQYLAGGSLWTIAEGVTESVLARRRNDRGSHGGRSANYYVRQSVSDWQIYHFHDTSMTSSMRRDAGINQTGVLKPDASNLAAFLLDLREAEPEHYQLVRKTLQRIAPYFDDFDLRIVKSKSEDLVRLTWRRKGSDYIFSPGHFSDGTIRFLCLIAALTQPSPPTTIVIDEPELGLHPEALTILAGLMRSASKRMQIVAATQSPVLLSEFEPGEIITVDQSGGASVFSRLDEGSLRDWLGEFTLGDLWQKGTIPGGITHG